VRTKTWTRGNKIVTKEILLTFCVINVIIVITVITVINAITFTSRLQQRTFKVQALKGQTTLHGKNKQRPFCTEIAVRIIRRRSLCVLTPLDRRGATSWIAGIVSGS